MEDVTKPVVFFDGYCGICNRFIDFLVRKDKRDKIQFASLQGETAKLLFPNGELAKYDSIAFYSRGKLHYKSGAVMRILTNLGRGWILFNVGYILPPFVRDALYDWVARNRYQWFGKLDSCRIPTEKERGKLLS